MVYFISHFSVETYVDLCAILESFDYVSFLIARFMGPTWGPSGADRTQVGPILASWTLLSGLPTVYFKSWSRSEMLLVIMTCICMCIRFIFLFYMSIWYHIALLLCTIRLSYFVRNDEIKMYNHIFGKMSLNNHPTIAHNTRHIYLVQRGGCLVMSYVTSPVFQACKCVLCVVACYISKCLRIINFILLHLERNYRQKGKYILVVSWWFQ